MSLAKQNLFQLYADMHVLTEPKCANTCKIPRSCCDSMYCDIAKEEALDAGVEVPETGHKTLPYMGPTGCTMPPHFRKICSLHVCSINAVGFDNDMDFTAKYFDLRNKIDELEVAVYLGDQDGA